MADAVKTPAPGPWSALAAAVAAALARAGPSDPWRLQMIARNGGLRLAVLNGRGVHAGDDLTIDGKTVHVVAINDDSVVLKQDGRRQTLQLIPHAGANPVCSGSAPQPGACRRSSPGASR
jgi:hypothetical protein